MPVKPLHQDPVPFITLPNWVKAAKHCGFNIEPVLRELGIETDLMNLESATIDRSLLERMMEICIARSRQHYFPFVLGETFAFDYLPDIETFLTTSGTLREALPVLDWVRELINPAIDMRLEERGSLALLVLAREETAKPFFIETTFASILKFGRALLGEREQFIELRLRYPAPAHAHVYADFLEAPVRFGQAENALVFDRSLLDRPLEGAFPSLHEQAQQLVEQRLQRLPRRTGVVAAIEQLLEQQPALLAQGIAVVADELGIG
ncbi:MAG: AraC family transcriptional regulator ligand-binding domain-containing protein, partial [Stenotrophobium sp.]